MRAALKPGLSVFRGATVSSGRQHCAFVLAPLRFCGKFSPRPLSESLTATCLCALHRPEPLPPIVVTDGPTITLINQDFSDLNIPQLAAQVGGIRVRQHVNPLKAALMVPVTPPKWEDVFLDPSRPILVDIGCGSGRFLMTLAKGNSESCNFLGLEIRQQVVSRANRWANELELKNVHFMVANATVSFGSIISSYPGSLICVTILCPDPHFKKKHHKRRIVQTRLVDEIVKALAPGGQVFFQSDVEEVAIDMRCQFDAQVGVTLISEVDMNPSIHDENGWLLENPLGVRTEREIHAIATGGNIYRVLYRRLS